MALGLLCKKLKPSSILKPVVRIKNNLVEMITGLSSMK